MQTIEGKLQSNGYKFAIVVGRFNELITAKLLSGAVDCLVRHGADSKDVTAIWVPGSFEVPQAVKKAVDSKKFDAVIALGTIIKGETPHFDYIAGSVTNQLGYISANASIPVTFGVLTTDTVDQALDRAGIKSGNKGWDAAITAIDMISVLKQM